MALTGLLGVASIVIGIVTGILQSATAEVLTRVPGGGVAIGVIGFVTPIVLIFLAFLAIYRLVPNRPVTIGEVLPGAVVATVLWTLLRFGFTWYTTEVANYETAFGPIAAAVSLLVFLYFASVIVLLGAEVARAAVLDNPSALPDPIFTRRPPPVTASAVAAANATRAQTEDERAVPPWALAIGGAAAAALVRWLSGRLRR
jgi:uncharacterized BrkB/YihY/UPF0761 family membrane protein